MERLRTGIRSTQNIPLEDDRDADMEKIIEKISVREI